MIEGPALAGGLYVGWQHNMYCCICRGKPSVPFRAVSLLILNFFVFHCIFHVMHHYPIRLFCVFRYFLIALCPLSLSPFFSWPYAQRKWTAPLSDRVRQFDLASPVPRLIDCPGVYLSHPLLPCILNQGPCNMSPTQWRLSHARLDSCQHSLYLSPVIYLFFIGKDG